MTNTEIRMRDERNEDGTGSVIVEICGIHGYWSELNTTWFYKDEPCDLRVRADKLDEILISQFTTERTSWTKRQVKNHPWSGKHYNMTVLKRK